MGEPGEPKLKKELSPQEKEEKSIRKFLEKETESITEEIEGEGEYLKGLRDLQKIELAKPLLKQKEMGGEIDHIRRIIYTLEMAKAQIQSGLEFKIETFKKLSPEKLDEYLRNNLIDIEKAKSRQEIDDLKQKNRIIEAIKKGKIKRSENQDII